MKWKRNNKTNVVSTNEEIIRICEEEGKKKKSHIPLGLIVVLIFALVAAGFANMWAAVFADVGVAVIAILNAMRTLYYKPQK